MRYAGNHPMSSRRLLQDVLALIAAITVLAMATAARADTIITPNTTNISRTVPLRTDPVTALWISRADCLANDVLTFPVVATGYQGSLEVWASNGASCLPPESRDSTAAQCWKVFSGAFTNAIFQVPIRVQDIAAMNKPPEFPQSVGTESSCTPPAGTASAAQPITLFFMDILGDQNEGGSSWETKLDLVGPAPPLAAAAGTSPLGIGNTILIPAWSTTGDIDVAGYNFFCAQVAAAATPVGTFGAGVGDAGAIDAAVDDASGATVTCSDASTDGGDDGASDAAPACTTPVATPVTSATIDASPSPSCGAVSAFVVGAPPTTSDVQCGSVAGAAATSFTITGLTNFTEYEVAVGSVDAVGNVGPLSTLGCAEPQPVEGFAENYRSAGGTGGGGFCSMGRPAPGRTGWRWVASSLLGLGLALGRRKSHATPS